MMNIMHLVSNLDDRFGGPSKSVPSISAYQEKHRSIIVYSKTLERERNEVVEKFSLETVGLRTPLKGNIYLSLGLDQCAKNFSPDIVHIHSIWRYPAYSAFRWAKENNIHHVCSVRSNLYAESLSKSSIVKSLAKKIFVMNMLQSSACVHATDERELQAIRDYGVTAPVALIPNGINVDLLEGGVADKDVGFLYLARLHPRKGVEELILAWLDFIKIKPGEKLTIAGSAENADYERKLKEMAGGQLNVSIFFAGHVVAEEKTSLLKSAKFFVLPTFFENFGISIAEALSVGVPVITTDKTPWVGLHNSAGYIMSGNSPELIKNTLALASSLERGGWSTMSENARSIAAEFNWNEISEKFNHLYEWILSGGEAPSFVYFP